MKLKTRDFVSTSLIVLLAACFVSYLLDGRIALVEGTRGMAGLGLLLGTVAYLFLSSGDPRDVKDKVEDTVALLTFLLGFVAFALAETAAAEVLLAVFLFMTLIVWALKIMDHVGVLYTRPPANKA